MPFQTSSETFAARLHFDANKKRIAAGLIVAVLLALGIVAWVSCSNGGFSVERATAIEQTEASGSENAEGAGKPASEGGGEEGKEQGGKQGEGSGGTVFVHVGGAVVSPGVYEMAAGSRVNDAVSAAGGFTADAAPDALNLAQTVLDGEQMIVPTADQYEQGWEKALAANPNGSSQGASARVNINTATVEELDALPGIGKATAEKIVADRSSNGAFASTEDLKRVSGIGDKKYEQLADLICAR